MRRAPAYALPRPLTEKDRFSRQRIWEQTLKLHRVRPGERFSAVEQAFEKSNVFIITLPDRPAKDRTATGAYMLEGK